MEEAQLSGVVLGVLGASGGVGSTALATACAVRSAAAGRDVVLVDAHPWGGGIEMMAGTDAEAGLRKGVLVGDAFTCLKQTLMFDLPIVTRDEVEALLKTYVEGGGRRTVR